MKAKKLLIFTLLAILALSTAACGGGGPSPAALEVTSLSVTPSEVGIEEEATVTVRVENTGGTAGTYTVELAVQGTTVQTKDVLVPPESARKARFQISEEQPVMDSTNQLYIHTFDSSLQVFGPFWRRWERKTGGNGTFWRHQAGKTGEKGAFWCENECF